MDFYKGHNATLKALLGDKLQGTAVVRLAYEEWLADEMKPGLQEKFSDNTSLLEEGRGSMYSFLLEEDRLNPLV